MKFGWKVSLGCLNEGNVLKGGLKIFPYIFCIFISYNFVVFFLYH